MGKRTDFCINGTIKSRGQSADHHFKTSEAIRLISDGVSVSKAAKMLSINYKLLVRLMDARKK